MKLEEYRILLGVRDRVQVRPRHDKHHTIGDNRRAIHRVAEVGLRELLQRHPDDLLYLPVDVEAVIRDMDTREEYEAEIQRWQREQSSNRSEVDS